MSFACHRRGHKMLHMLCNGAKNDIFLGSFQRRVEGLCEEGFLNEALQAVRLLDQQGLQVSSNMLYCILQGCMAKKDLAAGREAHHLIVKTGFQSNLFLGRTLIRMFALCGALSDANDVFHQLTKPDVSAWTAIISVNSKLGQDDQAAKLYQQMQESSVAPDGHAFVAVLKSCMAAKEMTTDSQNVI